MANPRTVSLVRPAPLPARAEVIDLVSQHIHLFEEDARVLKTGIDVPGGTAIDLLAVSGDEEILVIDVFDGANSSWLTHLLHHLAWIEAHHAEVMRQCGRPSADAAPRIRVAGVVARPSTPSLRALARLGELPVACFRVRCFTNGSGQFVALERQSAVARRQQPPAAPRAADTAPAQSPPIKPVELTEAEIADFLESEGAPPSANQSFI